MKDVRLRGVSTGVFLSYNRRSSHFFYGEDGRGLKLMFHNQIINLNDLKGISYGRLVIRWSLQVFNISTNVMCGGDFTSIGVTSGVLEGICLLFVGLAEPP